MRGECGEAGILGARIHVVDKQSDPDSAIGSVDQLLRQEQAGQIGVPDIGLHVEAAHGAAGSVRAYRERFGSFDDETKRRLTGMLRFGRRDRTIEGTVVAQRNRRVHWEVRPRRGAAHMQPGSLRSRRPECG